MSTLLPKFIFVRLSPSGDIFLAVKRIRKFPFKFPNIEYMPGLKFSAQIQEDALEFFYKNLSNVAVENLKKKFCSLQKIEVLWPKLQT